MNMTNQDYGKLVQERAKPSPMGKNMVWAFLVGGGICAAGLPPAENTVNRSAAPLHAAGWTEQGRCCVQCPARN